MSPIIAWPSASEISLIDDIRDAIGREVTFYVVASSVPCSICSLDPVTNESTNSFCPICSGTYFIPTYSGVSLNAHITWGGTDQLQWQTGGQLFDGDCRLQIKYTPSNVLVVENSKWVDVDGKRLAQSKVHLRGVKELNRILVDLIQDE
jgi:hypothetical protein